MRKMIGVVLGVGFLAAVVYATLAESQVSCEVCVDFGSRGACRSSSGVDRETAIAGAVSAACAVLSGGVTDGIRCTATVPRSVRCDD